MTFNLRDIQDCLRTLHLDGWLLYDYKKTNDLACFFLKIPQARKLTRRFFYWIPSTGTPKKIVHKIEPDVLNHLPGETDDYTTWQQLHTALAKTLRSASTIAMEYSPLNAVPSLSKVDGGTLDLVRSQGVQVVSSADLLQAQTSIWNEAQLESHLAALKVLNQAAEEAWKLISSSLKSGKTLYESDVQQFLSAQIEAGGCLHDALPICAVNAHSADPHFFPDPLHATPINKGDLILIDLWCKKASAEAVYADITRVAVAAGHPTEKQQAVFNIVKQARDAGMQYLNENLKQGKTVRGCDIDDACREVIVQAGYGEYFTHRTGHNLGEQVHGWGANIDHFETNDERTLLPGSCFTIEPGIYLPGDLGIRLEHDVYIEKDGRSAHSTGPIQEELICLI